MAQVAAAGAFRKEAAGWGGLLFAWALLAGLPLFLRPLLPIDETRYATVAWEMWVRGDFLVPRLNGHPYSDKPPLLFWLIHLGWRVFGVNEAWPRLVPALFSLANLCLTAALARRLWPDRPAVARSAPAVLIGFLLWSVFTGMLMFDMLVAFCALLALLGLLEAWRRGGILPWLQVGTALGLGILAKGPVVFLAPLFVAVLAPWWGRRPGWRAEWRWWAGLAGAMVLAAALALAWALPAARAGGPAYGNAILFSQTGDRMVHSFAHRRPAWWYLALLPGLLFPYSLWPPLWSALGRLRSGPADPGVRFGLAWTVPAFAAFSAISGKQPHYLLPLLPGLALLAARLLDETAPATTRWPRWTRWHAALPTAFLLLVSVALAAAPLLAPRPGWPLWVARVSPVAGVLLGLAAAAGLAAFHRIFPGRPAAPTLFSLALVSALHAGGSAAIHQAYDIGPAARYLASAERQGRPVAWAGEYHGQLHFLGRLRRPFEQIPSGSERLWLSAHPGGEVVEDLDRLPTAGPRPGFVQPYRTGVLAVWGS
ncbi:MAG TPA: glycosyltransferase family 39 protein [Thermoanaerobaculia bacterium]|jgi:4-amino-4-deoxy-L-arabinose transferase-like glycosyltransferase|nr:glycosyltransferase family 39 protein [Thermoanaerobaculia bacterium]